MKRPPKKYVCEKCGYLGDTSEHEGCDYLAWTTGEQEQWEHDEQRAMETEIISLREQVEKLTKERDEWMLDACPKLAAQVTVANEKLAAAPTPPVSEDRKDAERFREGWTHACNALCMEIALWIERCPHCGMPAPKAPAMQEDKP